MKNIMIAAALLAAFGIVGAMDYQDEQRAEKRYCEMVESGYWPDYREMGDDCNGH